MRTAADGGNPTLRDHWQWRPEWARDRPCFYWYLAVADDEVAGSWERLLDPLRSAPWLDVVPPRWWHVTMCDVGFVDELDRGTVDAVVQGVSAAVPAALHRPLRLSAGPVELFPSAVAVRVGPVDALGVLQAAVRDSTQRVLGEHRPLVHRQEFRPHVSLGYANRSVTSRELAPVLQALPDIPAEVDVDRLSLVAVTRRDGHYQWTVEHEVALGRQPGTLPRQVAEPFRPGRTIREPG